MEATAPELSAQQCVMRAGGVLSFELKLLLLLIFVFARLIKVLIGEHIFITAKAFTVGNSFRLTRRHSALISDFMSFLTVHTSSLIYKKIGCAVQSYCRREF